eukprot:GEZU01026510.1.p2 GENE.GEZU01026510.1~~GEZU01026510.1.p2  ORF type:complete len:175 (+),score=80.36 GEZU01026510.1:106-630(+)
MVLTPNEENYLKLLAAKEIPIEKLDVELKINGAHIYDKLQLEFEKDEEFRDLAKRAVWAFPGTILPNLRKLGLKHSEILTRFVPDFARNLGFAEPPPFDKDAYKRTQAKKKFQRENANFRNIKGGSRKRNEKKQKGAKKAAAAAANKKENNSNKRKHDDGPAFDEEGEFAGIEL